MNHVMNKAHASTTSSARVVLLALASLVAIGCGSRNTLSRTHGQSTRDHFAAQTVNPGAGDRKQGVVGLDTQDARAIAQGHRSRMAGKGAAPGQSPGFMIVSGDGAARAPVLPPPSVPQ
jgi:hypothetical protein